MDLPMHRLHRVTIGLVLLAGLSPWLWAGAAQETDAGPKYQVRVRLRLDAGRSQRVKLFRDVVARLKAAGMVKDQGLDGEEFFGDAISGTLGRGGLPALRRDPAVLAAVAVPADYQPAEGGALVRLHLLTDFGPEQQREVADKVRSLLAPLGFKESVGYDHDHHRQLLGRMPPGALDALLGDGFQAEVPVVPASGSLKSMKLNLVKLAVVLAEPAELPPAAAEAGPPPAELPLAKLHPDLRRLLSGDNNPNKPVRVEIVLSDEPAEGRAPAELRNPSLGLAIDGVLGNVVYGTILAGNLASLASWTGISDIRLPQPGRPFTLPCDFTAITRQPVGVEDSPARWIRGGKGGKVLVIAADFGNWEAERGQGLPRQTTLVDLTAELSPDLKPAPLQAGDGLGLALALDVARKLDGADLILVRIDPAAPFQAAEVARVLAGKLWLTGAFRQRLTEIRDERARLAARKDLLDVKRRLSLRNFGLDGDDKAARDAFKKEEAAFNQDSAVLTEKDNRAIAFRQATKQLLGAGTVIVGLDWDAGYALTPGTTLLGRTLPPELLRTAAWVQAVPRRGGQEWSGLFTDADRDGALDFEEAGPFRNLTFLSWRGKEKAEALLPAGAVLAATVTWQEAHDPRYAGAADDPYRMPLAKLQIVVLRQRDPSGQKLPADVFDVIARSPLIPERLKNSPRSATYRAEVRFEVPRPGRYALRIEGQVPASTQPAGAPVVKPEQGELRPILSIRAVDPASRNLGRPVLDAK
jgi:hypothetical protein